MTDNVPDDRDDIADESLHRLAAAAREAMLRTEARGGRPKPCPPDRLFVALVIDTLLGLGCLGTATFLVAILMKEGLLPRLSGIDGSLGLVVVSLSPLLYSAMDLLFGGTPGKLLTRIAISGPPPLRHALLRRWAIKGAPFIVACILSSFGLISALYSWLTSTRPASDGWPFFAGLALLAGFTWWLVASAGDRHGQTLADWFAGTTLVLRPPRVQSSGFEPVLKE